MQIILTFVCRFVARLGWDCRESLSRLVDLSLAGTAQQEAAVVPQLSKIVDENSGLQSRQCIE